jgi:hypothetical protein
MSNIKTSEVLTSEELTVDTLISSITEPLIDSIHVNGLSNVSTNDLISDNIFISDTDTDSNTDILISDTDTDNLVSINVDYNNNSNKTNYAKNGVNGKYSYESTEGNHTDDVW